MQYRDESAMGRGLHRQRGSETPEYEYSRVDYKTTKYDTLGQGDIGRKDTRMHALQLIDLDPSSSMASTGSLLPKLVRKALGNSLVVRSLAPLLTPYYY